MGKVLWILGILAWHVGWTLLQHTHPRMFKYEYPAHFTWTILFFFAALA